MDGRPHPPAWAPHTWTGFSTGEWIGNTLKITTTHIKDGYLRRGGPQTSDLYTMTDYLTRHGDILSIVTVIDDPVYMDEPFVQLHDVRIRSEFGREYGNVQRVCVRGKWRNGSPSRAALPSGPKPAWTEWLKNENRGFPRLPFEAG